MTPLVLPSGRQWSLRTLRRSVSLEALQVRERLARQARASGAAAREAFARAKTLDGDAALEADEQGADALIRAAKLSEAADGWAIQAVWTGAPLGATQGPEATGTAMLDALEALGWDAADIAYLAAASMVALCSLPGDLPGRLAQLAVAMPEVVAAEAAQATSAHELAVTEEVRETVPFGEAPEGK